MTDELLSAIELADIGCTRRHYKQLTPDEVAGLQFQTAEIGSAWLYAETRDGVRTGNISGLGLTRPAYPTDLEAGIAWLRDYECKHIRVRVASISGNEPLHTWLAEAGYKMKIRIHQWYLRTDPDAEMPVIRKRRNSEDYPFVIREIGADQAHVFSAIVAINYRYKPGADLNWLERQVSREGIKTFVAFDQDDAVGTGMLHYDGAVGVLGYGTTLKPYRRKGLQNAMIGCRVQAARQLGLSLAAASTYGTDQSSRNIRRQGFALAGQTILYTSPTRS